MVRDSQRYSTTGGWGFATYEGGSRTDNLDAVLGMRVSSATFHGKTTGTFLRSTTSDKRQRRKLTRTEFQPVAGEAKISESILSRWTEPSWITRNLR